MKKALVVLLVLAVVSVAAFADVKWSVSNLYGFGIVSNSVGNGVVGYDYSQVGNGRTRFTGKLNSDDGNVGFVVRSQDTALVKTASPIWNQLYGWGKLFGGMLTVKAGILDDYTISLGDWQCFGNLDGKTGVFFDATPIAGLDIGFYQYIPVGTSWNGPNGDVIGVSFLMPNVVRVGGGVTLDLTTSTATTGNQVYVFFDVKAVPGLTLNAEAQFGLYNGDTPITAAEDIGYAMGPLTVRAYVGEYMDKNGLDWGVEPIVSYKVNDNITVNAIVNAYSYGYAGVGNVTFMSPIDVGVLAAGATKTIVFGGGAFLNYAMGGFTLTVGDFYGADSTQGNLFFVNADVSL
jgi:hypothetical protein